LFCHVNPPLQSDNRKPTKTRVSPGPNYANPLKPSLASVNLL
jgi:hypothetical protein